MMSDRLITLTICIIPIGLLPLSNDASLSVIATPTDDQEEEAGSTTSDYDSMTTLTHSRQSSVTTSS